MYIDTEKVVLCNIWNLTCYIGTEIETNIELVSITSTRDQPDVVPRSDSSVAFVFVRKKERGDRLPVSPISAPFEALQWLFLTKRQRFAVNVECYNIFIVANRASGYFVQDVSTGEASIEWLKQGLSIIVPYSKSWKHENLQYIFKNHLKSIRLI